MILSSFDLLKKRYNQKHTKIANKRLTNPLMFWPTTVSLV